MRQRNTKMLWFSQTDVLITVVRHYRNACDCSFGFIENAVVWNWQGSYLQINRNLWCRWNLWTVLGERDNLWFCHIWKSLYLLHAHYIVKNIECSGAGNCCDKVFEHCRKLELKQFSKLSMVWCIINVVKWLINSGGWDHLLYNIAALFIV